MSEYYYSEFIEDSQSFFISQAYQPLNQYYRKGKSKKNAKKISSGCREVSVRFKTQVCRFWKNGDECPYRQACNYAHGDLQKRDKSTVPSKYKTKTCNKFYQDGCCPYGTRCQFIHHQPTIYHLSYQKKLQIIQNNANLFFEIDNLMKAGIESRSSIKNDETASNKQGIDQIIQTIDENEENYVQLRDRHYSQ